MTVSSLGRAARSRAGIKVRQPLSRVIVKARSSGEREGIERVRAQILEELNVKDIEFVESAEDLAGRPNLAVSEEGDYSIAIDTEVTPELADEGLAREVVHRLQTMRKNAGFDIADYITTYYERGKAIDRVLEKWGGYIKQETLSRQLVEGIPADAHHESHKIGGEKIELGVKRTG
jgi:isoleucyl-tRNA synthetase